MSGSRSASSSASRGSSSFLAVIARGCTCTSCRIEICKHQALRLHTMSRSRRSCSCRSSRYSSSVGVRYNCSLANGGMRRGELLAQERQERQHINSLRSEQDQHLLIENSLQLCRGVSVRSQLLADCTAPVGSLDLNYTHCSVNTLTCWRLQSTVRVQ